jgi:hypothetical protein
MKQLYALLVLFGIIQPAFTQTVNFTSSDLPVIVINTNGQAILDDPKITADMGIIDNGPGKRNNLTDTFTQYNGKIGIEIRGQSSQMFPMKSYSLELRDAAGKSVDKSLFGMPKESDWVLYAPYTDKTLMRNVLAYGLSASLGHWAARTVMVEVMLNGNYVGVYVFMERIKRNVGRVNITKMAKTDISGDAVTGGYIFSLDKEPNGWFSSYPPPNSSNGETRQFSYVVPKPEDMVPEQKAYLKSYVDSFENVLYGAQFQDTVNGVRKFADLSSFMDYFIVNEVSRNVDGYRLSTFMYKDRDSKDKRIVMGPVWDYDLAYRNADYCSGSDINGWAYKFNEVCPGDGAGLIPFWWNKLMTDTAFTGDLRCRWKSLRQTTLSLNRTNAVIDSIAAVVNESQQRHFTRWPVLGQYVWPNPDPIPTSYAGEISTLKDWLRNRLEWLDNNMPNAGACADLITAVDTPGADVPGTITMSVYPNPVGDNGRLKVMSKVDQQIDIRVIDMEGRIQMRSMQTVIRGENLIDLHSSRWARGVYFIEVTNRNKEQYRQKLVKL